MKQLDRQGKPIPFSVRVVEYNRQTKQGGRIVNYEGVTLTSADRKRRDDPPAVAEADGGNSTKKSPNHYRNKTRNLVLRNGEVRKIHIRLITRFNGHTVI